MADQIFKITNAIALFSWIFLMVFPYKKWSKQVLFTGVILSFAVLYFFLATRSFDLTTFQNFSTLGGVRQLFNDPVNVVIGWVHYLAFDLMVGLYIAKDAEQHQLNRFVLLPCFLLTFMLGPVGLLLYYGLRALKTKALLHPF